MQRWSLLFLSLALSAVSCETMADGGGSCSSASSAGRRRRRRTRASVAPWSRMQVRRRQMGNSGLRGRHDSGLHWKARRASWECDLEIPSKSWRWTAGDRRPRTSGFRGSGSIVHGQTRQRPATQEKIEEGWKTLYVTTYPPLFGVTVGNYTTSLAAHRVREAWRPRFPNALVVPLDLPLDAVFPPGNSPAHGPHLPPTHRD